MNPLYTRLQETARRLLKSFGQPLLIERSDTKYDPIEGKNVPQAGISQTLDGVILPQTQRRDQTNEINPDQVKVILQTKDKKFNPQEGDQLTNQAGEVFTIHSMATISPDSSVDILFLGFAIKQGS